jgi:hypothetical protein
MICNECETVAHCTKHGCVPKQPAPVQEPYAWHYKNAAGVSAWHFGPSRMFDADLEASKMWPRTHQLIPVYTENRRSISDCEELAALGWQAITCPSCGNVGARGYPRNAAPPAQPAPVQPVQEPVAWRKFNGFRFDYIEHQPALSGMVSKEWKPLYDTTPPAQLPAAPKNRKDALRKLLLSEDGLTAQECEWVNEVNEGDKVKLRGGQSAVKIKSVYRQRGLAPDYYTLILAGGDTLELSGDELADLYEPAAQPAPVPDAIGPNEDELPAYAAGWNECRQAMLEMMK